ncbi:ASXH domain-containing protein [Mycena kentingensis (nom. inval.)]|nr:ASXH domain-containing protein [Mycena kentingensis (nom. inval.)]
MADDASTSVRRSTRTSKPATRDVLPVVPTVPAKRKAREEPTPEAKLANLLQNPKSKLTKIDFSDVLNANAWSMLSDEAKTRLMALLPVTAFKNYIPGLDAAHPSGSGSRQHEQGGVPEALDPAVFTDAHFLAATRTFQDHLFSGWRSDAHGEKLKKYVTGTRDGTLAAPWKDEVWEQENASGGEVVAASAGDIKLLDLAKHSVIREGDVLAYKRKFSAVGVVVEKDVVIQRIDPRTHAITVLAEPGTTRDLPAMLLQPGIAEAVDFTRTMTISSPTQLEGALLDIDGRVERTKRPNANAWKTLTLWRWAGDTVNENYDTGMRGGRTEQGTLHYLRACHYQDR